MAGTTTHVDYLKRLTAICSTRRRLSDGSHCPSRLRWSEWGCRYPEWGGFAGDVVGAGGPGP